MNSEWKDNHNNRMYNDSTITVKAYGKLVLFGEHLVFYNSSVLGIPLSCNVKVTFFFEESHKHKKSNISELHFTNNSYIDTRFIDFIYAVCRRHHTIVVPKSKITIESTIPIGSGYGSSAALCVALAKGILYYNTISKHTVTNSKQQRNNNTSTQQTKISKKDIWYFAHHLEQFFHNPASGIDTALCTYEQAMIMHPQQLHSEKQTHIQSDTKNKNTVSLKDPQFKIQPLKVISQCLYIVSAVVAREHSTKNLIIHVRKQLRQFQKLQILQQLHNKALAQLVSYISHNNTQSSKIVFNYYNFANTVNTLQQQLCNLGLCTPTMQKAMNIAIKAGSIATKLSGAGGGGAFICFCATKEDSQNVYKTLQQYSFIQHLYIQTL